MPNCPSATTVSRTRRVPARTLPILCAVAFGITVPVLAGPAAPAAQSPQPLWVSGFKTESQRPVEVARIGKGNRYILFVGSVYGNEPESIELMDGICRLVRSNPPPEGLTILMVRTPNPDGLADHIHTNLHGVDLNRNFPSRQFTLAPTRLTGPHPASESETQYMVRVFGEYSPMRVIHIRSGGGERPLVLFNAKWASHGIEGTLPQGISQGLYASAFKAGSIEEYASVELGTEVATVFQSTTGDLKLQPADLLRYATASLPSSSGPKPLAESPKPDTPQTRPQSSTTPSRDGEKGAVDFLPPPPEYVTSNKIDQEVDRSDGRYQELPPPPR